jgi:hypothetical protein
MANPETANTLADNLALMQALDKVASEHPGLPDLAPLSFSSDGLHATPWLFCQPVTALADWVKALPGKVLVTATDLGEDGTRLTATGQLDGRAITLTVTTYRTGVKVTPQGTVSRSELGRLAAYEIGAPDLSKKLDIETIRAPHAPMPAVEEAPQTAAAVG